MSVRLSFCPHGTTLIPVDAFSRTFIYLRIFRISVEKIPVSYQSGTENRYFTWRSVYIFLTISHSVLRRMRNISNKGCRENQNTHFMFSNVYLKKKSYRLWDNVENILEPDRPRMTIWRMRIAFWIPKTANTHSQYVIVSAYPLPQWLYKGTSMFLYTSCSLSYSRSIWKMIKHRVKVVLKGR